jgi:hypothetical protein
MKFTVRGARESVKEKGNRHVDSFQHLDRFSKPWRWKTLNVEYHVYPGRWHHSKVYDWPSTHMQEKGNGDDYVSKLPGLIVY